MTKKKKIITILGCFTIVGAISATIPVITRSIKNNTNFKPDAPKKSNTKQDYSWYDIQVNKVTSNQNKLNQDINNISELYKEKLSVLNQTTLAENKNEKNKEKNLLIFDELIKISDETLSYYRLIQNSFFNNLITNNKEIIALLKNQTLKEEELGKIKDIIQLNITQFLNIIKDLTNKLLQFKNKIDNLDSDEDILLKYQNTIEKTINKTNNLIEKLENKANISNNNTETLKIELENLFDNFNNILPNLYYFQILKNNLFSEEKKEINFILENKSFNYELKKSYENILETFKSNILILDKNIIKKMNEIIKSSNKDVEINLLNSKIKTYLSSEIDLILKRFDFYRLNLENDDTLLINKIKSNYEQILKKLQNIEEKNVNSFIKISDVIVELKQQNYMFLSDILRHFFDKDSISNNELNENNKEIMTLNKKISVSEQEIENNEILKSTKNNELNFLKFKLNLITKNQTIENNEILLRTQNDITELEKNISDLDNSIIITKKEIAKIKDKKIDIFKNNKNIIYQKINNIIKLNLILSFTKNGNVKDILTKLENENTDLKNENILFLKNMKNKLVQFNNQSFQLENEISKIKNDIYLKEKELEINNENFKRLEQENKNNIEIIKNNNDEIRLLKTTNNSQNDNILKLKSNIADSEISLKQKELEIISKQQEIQDLKNNLNQLTNNQNNNLLVIQNLNNEILKLETDINLQKQNTEEEKKKNQELKNQNLILRNQNTNLQNNNNNLQNQNNNFRNENSNLRNQNSNLNNTITDKVDKLNQEKHKNEENKQRILQLNKAIDDLNIQINNVNNSYNVLNDKLRRNDLLRTEINSLLLEIKNILNSIQIQTNNVSNSFGYGVRTVNDYEKSYNSAKEKSNNVINKVQNIINKLTQINK
ncbi:hypothetical protein [Mycoplasma leonicaptivi]|uniref:hypothetical protein n=1 Tax=Mycoplasma leonicaptivi TaxID=36742 RepID=UPI000481A342|nr:hypothetical protein [Mycoplasma leonicaptivi]